jgi:hypothetical protein
MLLVPLTSAGFLAAALGLPTRADCWVSMGLRFNGEDTAVGGLAAKAKAVAEAESGSPATC